MRLVVVGCGAVFQRIHGPVLARMARRGQVEVTTVVDPRQDLRQAAARLLPSAVPAEAFSAVRADVFDAALILAPPAHHADMIGHALSGRARVLCEKPLTDDLATANSLLRRSRGMGGLVSVAMLRRQFDTYRLLSHHLPEIIDDGEFRASYHEGGRYKWPIQSASAFRSGPGGAGVLLDTGCHGLDLLTAMFGNSTVTRYADDADQTVVERNADLRLSFANGTARVRLSWTDQLPNGLMVEGRHGAIWMPLGPESRVFTRLAQGMSWRPVGLGTLPGSSRWNLFARRPCSTYREAAARQLQRFLLPDRPGPSAPLATLVHGVSVMSTIEDAYRRREEFELPPPLPAPSESGEGQLPQVAAEVNR